VKTKLNKDRKTAVVNKAGIKVKQMRKIKFLYKGAGQKRNKNLQSPLQRRGQKKKIKFLYKGAGQKRNKNLQSPLQRRGQKRKNRFLYKGAG
jgi:hypothetical protein